MEITGAKKNNQQRNTEAGNNLSVKEKQVCFSIGEVFF